jgi:hypothetical protein
MGKHQNVHGKQTGHVMRQRLGLVRLWSEGEIPQPPAAIRSWSSCDRKNFIIRYVKYFEGVFIGTFPDNIPSRYQHRFMPTYDSSRCRSQWPRGLRHELSSLARTLGSCVRIPLKAWMSVYIYCVFAMFCVGRGLGTGSSPVQEVLPTVYRIKKLRQRPRRNRGL